MSMLAAAAVSMKGTLHGVDKPFAGVSTDTRTLRQGELFVALQGPNFDGRDYVAQACDKGAAGAVVDTLVDEGNGASLSQVVVTDSKRALGLLGAAWREQLGTTVIGITGSNGKTTLKEMTAACLRTAAPTLATQGNLNNDIGMPLMLTRFEERHRFAVLEMGANHPGEIAYLTALAKPNVVVITNAAAAHLEGFGSIDGVARAKGEILSGGARPAIAVLNGDDCYFDYWASLVHDVGMLSFGVDSPADVRAVNIEVISDGSTFDLHVPGDETRIRLPLAGRHNAFAGTRRRNGLRRQLQREPAEHNRGCRVSGIVDRRIPACSGRHGGARRGSAAPASGSRRECGACRDRSPVCNGSPVAQYGGRVR
jgi:UDP-N-acetylmuramoyl-tripeptide--D-alanyl-D-alanine ligase